jgi:hypothetical protein
MWVPFHCKFRDRFLAGHSFESGSKGKNITLRDDRGHTRMAIGEIGDTVGMMEVSGVRKKQLRG